MTGCKGGSQNTGYALLRSTQAVYPSATHACVTGSGAFGWLATFRFV